MTLLIRHADKVLTLDSYSNGETDNALLLAAFVAEEIAICSRKNDAL